MKRSAGRPPTATCWTSQAVSLAPISSIATSYPSRRSWTLGVGAAAGFGAALVGLFYLTKYRHLRVRIDAAIEAVRLVEKTGGASGDFRRQGE